MSSKSFQNASKLNGILSVLEFGADPTGTDDSSTAINAALATGNSIEFPWGTYKCKDIVVGTHQSLYCNGSIFKPVTGANWIFKLTGFRPQIFDAYINGDVGQIPNDLTHAGVIIGDDSSSCVYPVVQNCMFVNLGVCLLIGGNTNFESSKGFVTNCNFQSFSLRGILLSKNALDFNFTGIRMYSGVEAGVGGDIPKRNCIGFQHIGTGSTIAYGGHLLNSVACLESETGFNFTDSTLTTLQNCIADSVAGAAYQTSTTVGGFTNFLTFDNCFAGTCKIGYEITGQSINTRISNPNTILSGVIPPWGGSNFYLTSGSYAVARDLAVEATSNGLISGWSSDAYLNPFFTSSLSFESSEGWFVGAGNLIAPASTVYLTQGGDVATEVMQFVAPKKGIIFGFDAQCATAPGAGQSFVYTVRVQGVDSGSVATITGASSFNATSGSITTFSAGQNVSIKLVTSATANQSTHRASLKVAYFG
jgi:hypothetical protein